jgi:hypothetical protein
LGDARHGIHIASQDVQFAPWNVCSGFLGGLSGFSSFAIRHICNELKSSCSKIDTLALKKQVRRGHKKRGSPVKVNPEQQIPKEFTK